MRRMLVCGALLFAVACDAVRERRAATTSRRPSTMAEPAPALPGNAPRLADPFARDYERAAAILRNWEDDPRELEAARNILTAIHRKDPKYAPVYVGLARVETRAASLGSSREHLAAAERLVARAIQLDPNSFDAYLALASITTQQRDFKRAHDAIKVAARLDRESLEVKLGSAQLASAEADTAAMLRHAQDVLAKSKDPFQRAAAYAFVVDAYESAGHHEGAAAAYREIIRLRPASATTRHNYAGFLLRRGDAEGAVREAEEALRLRDEPEAQSILSRAAIARADLLLNRGETANAAAVVDQLTARLAGSAAAWTAAGSFYERVFRRTADVQWRERALQSYRRALALESSDSDAAKALERLKGSGSG